MIKLVVALILITQVSNADCNKNLGLCDTALKASQKLVNDQGKEISELKQESTLQQQINSDLNKKLDSPLRDPIKVACVVTIAIVLLEVATGALK